MKLVNRELSAISNDYIWCSDYQNLNDPMEGIYGTSPWFARQTNFKRLASEILNQKRLVGICCFSDTHVNELMWVHYAKSFSGICVAYSTSRLRDGLDDRVHIARVAYDETPPRIGRDYRSRPQQAARAILSHKKSCWLYEREWRVLTSPEAGPIPGRLKIAVKSSVKAVYFGFRVKDNIRDKLVDKLTKMKIEIRTIKVSGYEHKWVKE